MKTKTIIKVLLLGFVVVSLSWAIIKQNQKETPRIESNTSSAEAPSNSLPASGTPAENNAKISALPDRIIAYYFHTTYRCPTCLKIEAYTKEAIETGFAKGLRDGSLVFQVINIEEPANVHFVQDYQLYTKSVVLVEFKNGKQARWKNLSKVWELVGNKEVFSQYIRDEVTLYLQGK